MPSSLDLSQISDVVNTRFKTLITTGLSLPTQFDNDASFTNPDNSVWCRFNILFSSSDLLEIGAQKTTRHSSVFIAQIFGPLGKGTKDLMTLAAAIFDAFSSRSVDGITYRTVSVRRIGRSQGEMQHDASGDGRAFGPARDGRWWQINVVCPFHGDQITDNP